MLGEIPAVTTATRLPQARRDSPAMVTVITRDMIEASGLQQIPELLRLVPGFVVGFPIGNFATVGNNTPTDAYSRRLQVLVDGQSVYTPFFSIVDWLNLPLEINDVDRIEVVHGPSVTTYGSNAFLATVNIITRRPVQDEGTTLQGTVGSWDTRNAFARYAHEGEKLSYRVSGAYLQDDGFDEIDDDRRARKLYGLVEYRPDTVSEIDFHAGYTNASNGVGGTAVDTSTSEGGNRDRDVDVIFTGLTYNRILGAKQELKIQAYYDGYSSDDQYQSPLLSDVLGVPPAAIPLLFPGEQDQRITLAAVDGKASRLEIEGQHTIMPSRHWHIVWGGSIRQERFDSEFWTEGGQAVEQGSFRLFANGEWRPDSRWTINAGAMFESYQDSGEYTSPRLGINYHISKPVTLRAAATRAYRIPSLFETEGQFEQRFNDGELLNIAFAKSPGLDPEEITEYELGLLVELNWRGLVFDSRLFQEDINNWIDDTDDPSIQDPVGDGAQVLMNNGELDIKGVELQLQMQPWRNGSLWASYTYVDADGTLTGQRAQPKELVPQNAVSLLLGQRFDSRWQLSGTYFHVDGFEWDGDGNTVGDYDRVDLRLAKAWRIARSDIKAAVIGQSVTGSVQDFATQNVFDSRLLFQLTARIW